MHTYMSLSLYVSLSLYIYIYIHIRVYIYIYIYTYAYIYIYIYTNIIIIIIITINTTLHMKTHQQQRKHTKQFKASLASPRHFRASLCTKTPWYFIHSSIHPFTRGDRGLSGSCRDNSCIYIVDILYLYRFSNFRR